MASVYYKLLKINRPRIFILLKSQKGLYKELASSLQN